MMLLLMLVDLTRYAGSLSDVLAVKWVCSQLVQTRTSIVAEIPIPDLARMTSFETRHLNSSETRGETELFLMDKKTLDPASRRILCLHDSKGRTTINGSHLFPHSND